VGARWREPVGSFPAQLGAEHRATFLQTIVERRSDTRAPALILLVREGYRVVLAIGLQRALPNPVTVTMQAGKAADIDDPQIERRLSSCHPFGQRPAGASPRGDAEGVETGAHEHVGA